MLVVIAIALFINLSYANAANYHNYESSTVSCGAGMLTNIPVGIPKIVSMVYMAIQIAVPVVLVVIGMIDLTKSIASEKEEDIKKSQKTLIKRLISAVLIFFVFAVVKFLISLVADTSKEKNKIIDCAECFINNECKVEK